MGKEDCITYGGQPTASPYHPPAHINLIQAKKHGLRQTTKATSTPQAQFNWVVLPEYDFKGI